MNYHDRPPEKNEPVTQKYLSRFKVEIALILVAVIINAVISPGVYSYQPYLTDKNEKQNIASAYLIEIENLEPGLSGFLVFNASGNLSSSDAQVNFDNFYPSYDLYYSNRADIFRRWPNGSMRLFIPEAKSLKQILCNEKKVQRRSQSLKIPDSDIRNH